MKIGCNNSEKTAAGAATARLDRDFTGAEQADWLDQAVAQFRSAIIFHIPEGYQDATGFHYGADSAPRRIAMAAERAAEISQRNLF